MGSDAKYQKLISRIAGNIKRVRESRKLTQEDMTQFGFSYRHYQRVESGKYSINLFTLHRVAIALKVDVVELFR